ncbi:putative adenylyltransferase/sulfurtransferase MoeZ [Hartmannibacter diazotrophicus]|uniref:Putative adenylyltransferase/sulfurtransferase MoeZ n=1 Tax=Hartmannibacter diazotrophicus TaxID=1482074 RepID=A0A2C9DA89_9HYPH|nr:rhodanese-like domain-containing protein [Hartmannibacter diazotrophicus]SON57244.1 putative adenylyltransferase/sulfurtransferase MoeZ [Hartmannibacter diazotrophicus]
MRNLTIEEVRDLATDGEIILVDVREDDEWIAGRIAGALHAPLSRFANVVSEIPTDKPVVFYCLAGARSAQAIGYCQRIGLDHDSHMAGGIKAWLSAGFPIEG